ncbi:hypothetical protein ADLP1_012 [Acinetobacter phage vB_AbaM_DLP1]|nr:hypothetical protein ADLP1_012 [Acinetobacter phage vB_AbaM_DLP1]WBF78859.1 hypothetical protein ADLP2_011 [Acinetobacter phage vB_AbaM_DLP2]CAH1068707.1 Uncharacterised protein [Acinetobacter phage MD-2021a]CAH1068986.1 Uncharacterised protein [Acinetobacter phage MD-2021a]
MKLTATIYNNLVKVFNDAANLSKTPNERKLIIEARKRFPTYNELLNLDLDYDEVSIKRYAKNPLIVCEIDEASDEGIFKHMHLSDANLTTLENNRLAGIRVILHTYSDGKVSAIFGAVE